MRSLLIKKEYKRQGLSIKEFGKSINRHPKTIANIFKRKTIDTQLLQSISKALNHDFFRYYYDEELLKSLREFEMKENTDQVHQLKAEMSLKNDFMSTQSKYVQSQKEVIRLLKEKEKFLKN